MPPLSKLQGRARGARCTSPVLEPEVLWIVYQRDGAHGATAVKTKEEWRDLAKAGQPACLAYAVFAEFFPPGVGGRTGHA